MALGLYYLGGDPSRSAMPAAERRSTRCACGKARCCSHVSGAARDARPDDDARAGGAERAGQRRRRRRASRRTPPTSSPCCAAPTARAGAMAPFLLSDGIGVGYGARPTRTATTRSISSRRRTIPSSSSRWPIRCACALRHRPRHRRAGALPRRLRHHARIRDAGRGGAAGGAHRQRGEPALGHRRRQGRRHRARASSIRARRTSACCGRCRTATASPRRHVAHRDRRRRRLWPSVRPSGRGGAGGRARRLRQRRGGRARTTAWC